MFCLKFTMSKFKKLFPQLNIDQVGSLRALPQPAQELKQANRLFGSPVPAPVAVPRYGESFSFLML